MKYPTTRAHIIADDRLTNKKKPLRAKTHTKYQKYCRRQNEKPEKRLMSIDRNRVEKARNEQIRGLALCECVMVSCHLQRNRHT